MYRLCRFVLLTVFLIISVQTAYALDAPVAKTKSHEKELTGITISDDYYWMQERRHSVMELFEYLMAENEYADAMLEPVKPLEDKLYDEIMSKIEVNYEIFLFRNDEYIYFKRFESFDRPPKYMRRKIGEEQEETILTIHDEKYLVRQMRPSKDNKYIAFTASYGGYYNTDLYIKDLTSGKFIDRGIISVIGYSEDFAWGNDNRTIYYCQGGSVYSHIIGSNQRNDKLIYSETNQSFYPSVNKSSDGKYLFITAQNLDTSEVWYRETDDTNAEFRLMQPVIENVQYYAFHHDGYFYFLTNVRNGHSYEIMRTPVDDTLSEKWESVIEYPELSTAVLDRDYKGVRIFKNFMVVIERNKGIQRIRVVDFKSGKHHFINMPHKFVSTRIDYNLGFDTDSFFLWYFSACTSLNTCEYNTVDRTLSKFSNFDKKLKIESENYKSKMVWATANDGTEIPVTIIFRKDMFKKNGENPLLLEVYGSYGYSLAPSIGISETVLLDRGFVIAYAHVRGGGFLGEKWHDEGQGVNKVNTFTDFISCAEYLVNQKFTSREKLVTMGYSAGGAVVAYGAIQRPELFKTVIAMSPAVDILDFLLDFTEAHHFEEWGDPHQEDGLEIIMSFCPYSNLRSQNYPNILVFSGYVDNVVEIWNPAKWVAKLRTLNTGDKMLLFKINMDRTHAYSGILSKTYHEQALLYSFMLHTIGMTE
jgi:oligopeptidase B